MPVIRVLRGVYPYASVLVHELLIVDCLYLLIPAAQFSPHVDVDA